MVWRCCRAQGHQLLSCSGEPKFGSSERPQRHGRSSKSQLGLWGRSAEQTRAPGIGVGANRVSAQTCLPKALPGASPSPASARL